MTKMTQKAEHGSSCGVEGLS